jgi:Neurochondrin
MGKLTGNEKGDEDKEVYLRLAVTVLAAFSRVAEIASLAEIVDMVPLVAEIVSKL